MTVKVSLELKELQLQISGRPEQRPVETFAAYRADAERGRHQQRMRGAPMAPRIAVLDAEREFR
jgi:hypothetical protein